jgi:hypothetical protein
VQSQVLTDRTPPIDSIAAAAWSPWLAEPNTSCLKEVMLQSLPLSYLLPPASRAIDARPAAGQ